MKIEFINSVGEWEVFEGSALEVSLMLQKKSVNYGTVKYRIISNIPFLQLMEEE